MTRVLIAGFKHETNTFCRQPADMNAYRARALLLGDDVAKSMRNTRTEIAAFLDFCTTEGWEVRHPIHANAMPSGPVTQAMHEYVRDHILESLRTEGPFDALLLCLHGAMACEHTEDGEGELLAAIREQIGPDVPIAATLDLHANVTDRMAELADILVPYRTYPHIDQYEVATVAAGLIKRTLAGTIKPKTTVRRGAMLDGADHGRTTTQGPMTDVLASADRLLVRPDVLAAGVCAGFPWADTHDTGPTALIVGDGDTGEHGALADALVQEIWDKRHISTIQTLGIEEAMARVKQARPGNKPIVLADFADNPGGGGYGDGTRLLKGMLDANLANAAFGTIYDPGAAELCRDNGLGAIVHLDLGGRTDPAYGAPLSVRCTVKAVTNGQFRMEGPMTAGLQVDMGTTAVVTTDGIDVVVTSRRFQVYDQMFFRHARIDPLLKNVVAVKSAHHFRAAFQPIAAEVLVVDGGGGLTSRNYRELTYEKVRRPVYPLDLD
ncbi:MAG: M81 family metallopeptidase [Rhodospirillaceae bacterium]|nr:M81 family metallopeptidase [Rhodospirillaceae bacterium]